ncbi:hypothetical protein L4C36_17605 [Photobacterium japonica]|uniref:hypothetical protein n=1 Tax=Photobacterium japonica TaxID=2910235 RepID=UPI003D152CD8
MQQWIKRTSVASVIVSVLVGCGGGSNDSNGHTGGGTPPVKPSGDITAIALREHLYPRNFTQALQVNMDYFIDGVGVSTLANVPFDHIVMQPNGHAASGYTNTTAIALYLNLLVEMHEAGDEKAVVRLEDVITQLEQAPHWNGLFYWLYTLDGEKLTAPENGVVSAVDNGNLSFSLAAVSGAFYDRPDTRLQQLAARVDTLLNKQVRGWSRLYDGQKGLLRAGWDRKTNNYLTYYVDRKANESRLAVIWAVLATQGSGTAVPSTAFTDMEVVTGEYNQNGEYFEPMLTWDGSYFQAMLPALWLNERDLMPNYDMVEAFSEVHKRYADPLGIPFLTASATVDNGYRAFGVEAVSEGHRRYGHSIAQAPTGSPHALALYALVDEQDAIARLLALKAAHPAVETSAGWVDAIDSQGRLSQKIIGIDQGMFVGAFLADEVRDNVTRYMARHGWEATLATLYSHFVADITLAADVDQ